MKKHINLIVLKSVYATVLVLFGLALVFPLGYLIIGVYPKEKPLEKQTKTVLERILPNPYEIVCTNNNKFKQDPTETVTSNSLVISKLKGKVLLSKTESNTPYFTRYFGLLLIWLAYIFITVQLRNIVKSIMDQNPFVQKNIRRIKNVGLLFVILPIVLYLLGMLSLSYLPAHLIFKGIEYNLEVTNYIFEGIVIGGLIYVFAIAFEKGLQIQQDQELTV